MSAKIFVEGGAKGKKARAQIREAFRKLFRKCDFGGRLPAIAPSGSRNDAFDDFKNAIEVGSKHLPLLLVDSEDPVADIERTWAHLAVRDPSWTKPTNTNDEHVLLMTTCMETWFVTDREALREFYGNCLDESKLPADTDREQRNRKDLFRALENATKDCLKQYGKGDRSFALLQHVEPGRLEGRLPSFSRILRILRRDL